MNYRYLGSTGLQVSEIGFGSWQLCNDQSWGAMDEKTAQALILAAVDGGVTLFDTAPNYAEGRSEAALGKALAGLRDQLVLVSKFGHTREGETDFSLRAFWQSLEGSLSRLRTDYLDVLLLHNAPASMFRPDHPVWDALEQARAQGKIRFFGASLDSAAEANACISNSDSQVVEVLFNILHQDVRAAFAALAEHGVGVIAKVPLDSGWLTGRFGADKRFAGIRDRWTDADIKRRAQLVEGLGWLTADGSELAHNALAYTLSYPEVSCAIPGTRTLSQLASNLAAVPRILPPGGRERLEHFWESETENGARPLPW